MSLRALGRLLGQKKCASTDEQGRGEVGGVQRGTEGEGSYPEPNHREKLACSGREGGVGAMPGGEPEQIDNGEIYYMGKTVKVISFTAFGADMRVFSRVLGQFEGAGLEENLDRLFSRVKGAIRGMFVRLDGYPC